MRYSAQPIIDFICNPKNGFIVDGGIPQCPKEKDCQDDKAPCSCHQKFFFYRQNPHYAYFCLHFTYPIDKGTKGDGYIDEQNGTLSLLVHRKILNQHILKPV